MSPLEQRNALKHLQVECLALEEEAGISKTMRGAREGRLSPLGLGAMGEEEDASPNEYFADEYDHFRDEARDAYFSVQEAELRKKLIVAQRKIDSHVMRSFEADIAAANHAVLIATAKIQNQPWTKAAVIAVDSVASGYYAFGFVGAIAGAVGGFFLGQGVVSEAKSNAIIKVNQATQELEEARKERAQRSLWPECFSLLEEITGEREQHLDRESAYRNILQAGKGS